jgi:hypothetical protein
MSIEIYQNSTGVDCVMWTDENGVTHSMLKSTYDEMIAKQDEASTL